ncbi:isochorismatase family protein [Pelagibius marinus]|uniref:isochorismatase family protein n=1 Tax=Pelagibius marinus TaxID=2762760 RepID=UPI0018725ACA|nr:isochorismatase family protein [Pelagibius marinus]
MVLPRQTFKGAGLLLVDIQERLAPAIAETSRVLPRIAELVRNARVSELPILATEQYSRGLGPTLPELRGLLRPEEVVEKIHFAAPRAPAFRAALQARGITRCFVAGMEAHVCVLQSVLSLLSEGVAVTLIGDAVASRVDLNRRLAVARMARAGAEVSDSAAVCAGMAALAAP